jgi:hypothetical protein
MNSSGGYICGRPQENYRISNHCDESREDVRVSPDLQSKICDAISELLEDELSQSSLPNFAHCLFILDLYEKQIPADLLNELHDILNKYVKMSDEGQVMFRSIEISDDEKMELAEQLLSIYIEIKGGGLIF